MLSRPILVPLDGSELSERALPYALAVARVTSRSLSLLSVWEGADTGPHSGASATAQEIDLPGRARREVYLKVVAQRLAVQGFEVAEKIRDGDPSEEVLRYCSEHPPALLVMATHGRSGIHRMWYGSVASRLMRAASVPTLLVGPRVLEESREVPVVGEILVPLEGSPVSELALKPAVALAEAFQARLILAKAIRAPSAVFAHGADDADLGEMDREVTAAAVCYLSRVREGLKTPQPVDMLVLQGHPGEAILELVAKRRVDLVVMASHARSAVVRWTLGSVAERVIRGAAPVLLIRPEVAATLARCEQVRGMYCHNCGRAVAYVEVARDDRCLHCRRNLHVCANCAQFVGLTCRQGLLDVADPVPGLDCPHFQFRERIPAEAWAAAAPGR